MGITLGYFWSYDDTLNFFHNYSEPGASHVGGLYEARTSSPSDRSQYQPQIWPTKP